MIKKYRIAVIEPDRRVSEPIKSRLARFADVMGVDGITSFKMFHEDEKFHLVLIAEELGNKSGSEVARELMRDFPALIVVGISFNYTHEGLFNAYGVKHFVQKQKDLTQLVKMVRKLLKTKSKK